MVGSARVENPASHRPSRHAGRQGQRDPGKAVSQARLRNAPDAQTRRSHMVPLGQRESHLVPPAISVEHGANGQWTASSSYYQAVLREALTKAGVQIPEILQSESR